MAAGERIIPAVPFAGLPPGVFVFTGEDVLELTSWSPISGLQLVLHGRIRRPDGKVQVFSTEFTTNGTRVAQRFVFNVGVGELLNVSVFVALGIPLPSQLLVRVAVQRGTGPAVTTLGTLIQGKIAGKFARAWPGAEIQAAVDTEPALRYQSGTDPAAGVNISEAAPTGALWQLIGAQFTLVTDATAGNRRVSLTHNFGVWFPWRAMAPAVQAPSTTQVYTFGVGLDNLADAAGGFQQAPIPNPALILAPGSFQTLVTGFAAGDDFGSPQFQVKEWLTGA